MGDAKAIEVLRALRDKQPINIKGIYEAVRGSLSSIEQKVNFLINAGLICETKQMGRGRFLALTPKGMGFIEILNWLEKPRGAKAPDTSRIEVKPMKWIILLLHTLHEIKGSTRLEKLLFLLKEEFKVVREPFYSFQPYMFGPFSAQILKDVRSLWEAGLVEIEDEVFEAKEFSDFAYIRRTYKLTNQGQKAAQRLFEKLDKDVKRALFDLKAYNSMNLANLLDYVYKTYPQYSPPPDEKLGLK